MARHFFRCKTCLTPYALELEDVKKFAGLPACPWCGYAGEPEYMGEVVRDRLTVETALCPCDDRCTSATGPKCDCQCGGKNHGKGWLVVIADNGAVPVEPGRADKALIRRREFEAAKDDLTFWLITQRETVKGFQDAKSRGEWVSGEGFNAYIKADGRIRAYNKACNMHAHKARLGKLAKIQEAFNY